MRFENDHGALVFYILGNFSCGEILDQNNPPKAGMQIGRSL